MHFGFSIDESANAKEKVNQWLGIAFISVLCFWIVLYYFTERAVVIGDTYEEAYASMFRNMLN